MSKDFKITKRTIEINVDDLIYNVDESVAIFVKGMNNIENFTETIEKIKEVIKELKICPKIIKS